MAARGYPHGYTWLTRGVGDGDSYTWIELDYSTGTPYSESLTTALADNQGRLDRVENSLDEYGLLVPTSPPPVASASLMALTAALAPPAALPSSSTTSSGPSQSMPTLPPVSSITGRKRRRFGSRRSLAVELESCEDDTKTAAIGLVELEAPPAFPPPSLLPEAVQSFVTLIGDHHPPDMTYCYAYSLPPTADELEAASGASTSASDDSVLHLPLGRLSQSTMQRVSADVCGLLLC